MNSLISFTTVFNLLFCMLNYYIENRDVNFDMIKMEGKPGGRLEETELIHGIVIDKDNWEPQLYDVMSDWGHARNASMVE